VTYLLHESGAAFNLALSDAGLSGTVEGHGPCVITGGSDILWGRAVPG